MLLLTGDYRFTSKVERESCRLAAVILTYLSLSLMLILELQRSDEKSCYVAEF